MTQISADSTQMAADFCERTRPKGTQPNELLRTAQPARALKKSALIYVESALISVKEEASHAQLWRLAVFKLSAGSLPAPTC